MSAITQKSKNTNTFRFKSFADRVNEIDIRRLALYHIGHQNEELPENNETYFHQTLQKWMVLNLTDEFNAFSRKCTKIVTLPQLLHQKDFVIDQLLEHLCTATNLSLQPLLELLYVLARDLREDYYGYFQRILDRLICLLNTQDADQLEWTSVCLAYLFKLLKPFLKKNIGVVFNSILPLLDEQYYDEHITNFAVECFSFIARDIRDYRKLMDFVLDTISREQTDSVRGCGRLLFEIIRGVQGMFHSVAGDFLKFLFEYLIQENGTTTTATTTMTTTKQKLIEQKMLLLNEIVNYAINTMLQYIEPKYMCIFWTKLCAVTQSMKTTKKLTNLLPIYIAAAQYRHGKYLSEVDVIVPTILQQLDNCMKPTAAAHVAALKMLSQLVSKIVLAHTNQVTQLDISRLVAKILRIKQREIYEEFVLSIIDSPQFEMLVLPDVVKYFEQYFDIATFVLLSKIVLHKRDLCLNATSLKAWTPYEIKLQNVATFEKLTTKLKHLALEKDENLESQILLLLILPHLTIAATATATTTSKTVTKQFNDNISKQLANSTAQIIQQLQNATGIEIDKLLLILTLLLQTQFNIKCKMPKELMQQVTHALLPHATNLRALGALDQLLTKNVHLSKSIGKIADVLAQLLQSHDHELRLTSAHCLYVLHKAKSNENDNDDDDDDINEIDTNPYKIFYEAECIEPNIHTYREQLLLLQQLQTSGEFFKSFRHENYKTDALRFLLGMLYNNFKFIWEPVLKLIEEYAHNLDIGAFWEIYKQKLDETNKSIAQTHNTNNNLCTSDVTTYWQCNALNELLPAPQISQLNQQELYNYRNLLWLRLPHFGKIVEIKNHELVNIFLEFVNEEYRKNLEKREFTWDLAMSTNEIDDFADDVDNDDDDDGDANTDDDLAETNIKLKKTKKLTKTAKNKNKRKDKNKSIVKIILQTLQTKMGIFVVQPNPKALYREPELYAFYMDLLSSPNAQLQKISLDCVLAYKMKSLQPHKEQLYAIIDESKFKDELTNFKLNDTVVKNEHRAELMKILLRILYGKMITKGTQRTISPQMRKRLILRFLGQCTSAEIFSFMQMAFGKYDKYTIATLEMQHLPALICDDFDFHAVWSAKKLRNIVNLLELLRKEFGGLTDNEFKIYMLKLYIFVGSACNEVLKVDSTKMHPKMPTVYKNVKNVALLSVVNFFEHIEEFDWQSEQIKCLTDIYVWPTIEKMPLEAIHTPTALLKLLLQWGERRQHFHFLQQQHPTNGHCIFYYMIELFGNERAKPAVRKPILELIERLLVNAATEKKNESIETTTTTTTTIQAAAATKDDATRACCLSLLLPHLPQILKRLKTLINVGRRRVLKQSLDKRVLNILSLLTAHVDETTTCDSLLQLLLPIFLAKTQSSSDEETIGQIVATLSNLIKRLDAPETYLLKIAPFFEQINEVSARKSLCQLLVDIAKIRHKETKLHNNNNNELCENLKTTARLILMLNSWSKRWIEQPDYDKRLDALKEITQMLEVGTVDLTLGILIIYNCFYFLRYDKDMGLRDNASEHLKILVPKLVQKYAMDRKQLDYLVGDVFINLIKRTINDTTNENVRNEGIRLLGEMSRECAKTHEILMDLAPLSDKKDLEIDFFENMTHLQTHRHGRALLRFCAHAENLTKAPNTRTLTQFMLPLASRYLLQEKHASKHTLIDAAIETIGVICQLLPWQHYHSILRFYLMKMRTTREYQKQCVRIVVRILDAFHFDLTQTNTDQQYMQQLKNELSEIDKKNNNTDKKQQKQHEATKQNKKIEVAAQTAVNGKQNDVGGNDDDDDDDDGDDDKEIKETDEVPDDEAEANLAEELASSESTSDDDDDNENAAESALNDDKKQQLVPVLKQTLLLSRNASKRVLTTITTILIPTLNRSITERSSYDMQHKVNRKRLSADREEEEILRVPIALALVKLMQKLPQELLESSLSGVFMKVCTFLRSPLKSVRMLTRDILKKIMLTLGSKYLPLLLEHLQSLLTRGFQVHVLSVTLHGVLDALRTQLQLGDIDNCLTNLLEVTLNDIFGDVTAEKENQKIGSRTPEAKPSAKSYLILHIVARNIKETCLLDLLMPFKDHLARTQSRKVTLKIQDCFAKIVAGLVENPRISRESLLIFIWGTMSESITDLLPGEKKRILTEKEKETMRRARPDCYIIQPVPRMRSGAVLKTVKSNAQANAHILIEFGLNMLHMVLKRRKLLELDYAPFLNPLLPLLKDALKSTHIRVTNFALKCFATMWSDEYDLDALAPLLKDIVERLFEILKNFSTFGATKQEENLQLMKSIFKAIVALLRKCKVYEFTNEQIEQLILQVEQDLFEGENQAMCFNLLKAIITRRIDTQSLRDIMKRVSDLSIVSQSDFARDEARNILLIYIMEYPLNKRVDHIVKFFTVQLCYSLPNGRQSAIKFLNLIIKKFPMNLLSKRAEFLFLSLATRLVNDEDTDCRKSIAETIELLITRLEKNNRTRLFDITIAFFEARHKSTVREMAASLCSRFVNVEKQAFAGRLKQTMPLILAHLTLNNSNRPGKFVRAPTNYEPIKAKHFKHSYNKSIHNKKVTQNSNAAAEIEIAAEDETEASRALENAQRAVDHEIIQMQYCLLKIFDFCAKNLYETVELRNIIDELAYESQKMLAHEHAWVRTNAVKIIAQIMANFDFNAVGRKLCKIKVETDEVENIDFIYTNPEHDIKCLILDLCAQVIPGDVTQLMLDEIVKIFLFIANMLRDVPLNLKKEKEMAIETETEIKVENNENEENTNTKINLYWLMRNIRYLVNKEVVKAAHSTIIRSAFFTLIESLITLLTVDTLEKLAPSLLLMLVREMSEDDQSVDADLRQLALHVGSRLRKRIGSDVYDKMRAAAQTKLLVRRAERKKLVAQEKIHDPMRAAKRKVGTQERKKLAKKRKVNVIRGKMPDVKQKMLKKRKRKAEDDLM